MTLRYLLFNIRHELESGISSEFSSKFDWNNHFIWHYLSLEIRKQKLQVDNFRMIWITLSSRINKPTYIYSECFKSITISIPFCEEKQKVYLNIDNWLERFDYNLAIIEEGLSIANNYTNVHLDKLLEITNNFRNNNFRNEWIFTKKMLREHNVYIMLKCYFTHCEFRLELEVYNSKKDKKITNGVVIRTLPVLEVFERRFKKVQFTHEKMEILDASDHESFEFDIELLSKGIFNIKRMGEEEILFKSDLKDLSKIKLLNVF